MDADEHTPSNEARRLPRQSLNKLITHQIAASIATVAAAVIAVALVTVTSPETWLWPAASGGSLRHWIVGIGLGALALALVVSTLDELDRQVSLAMTGRFPLVTLSAARTVMLAAVAAVLTWPVWGQVAHAWQVNDLAAAAPVAREVAVRLIPVLLLLLVPAGARHWISAYGERLWQHQHEHTEHTETEPAGSAAG